MKTSGCVQMLLLRPLAGATAPVFAVPHSPEVGAVFICDRPQGTQNRTIVWEKPHATSIGGACSRCFDLNGKSAVIGACSGPPEHLAPTLSSPQYPKGRGRPFWDGAPQTEQFVWEEPTQPA
jgi:hypothetical protein